MNCEYVTVYNQDGEMLGVLENAGEVAYNLVHNDLWTASFTLPSGDPKNSLCQAHNLVHLPDGARDTGLYRIIGMPSGEETAAGGAKTYSLEHVMATLLDDVLFGYHEIGGPGVTTAQVIQYILDQQHTERWVLGECEYSDQFAYKFENTSLLSALLSLGNVLTDEYTWVFDTSASPWTVSLKHADATPGCGIHYRRNMVEVEKEMDASTLVTRLYMLGYGEGVNQLTIRDINGGVPYIDADTKNVWGVKSSVYADTRIEDAATLKARGVALLNRLKNPYISYTASAVDLTRLTGQEWDKHMPGKLVRVLDGEHGIDFDARIVSIAKSDVRGRPGEIDITIANAPRDAADSINTLADRMGISELYSQGATNLYSQQYADNADAQHPAKMRVYVPSGCVRINQMLLSWQMEAFRAYETGAAAGGATATTTSSGGASTQTSSSGGGSERTSNSGGAYAQTIEQKVVTTTAATGPSQSGHSGSTSGNTGYALGVGGDSMSTTGSGGSGETGNSSLLTTDSSNSMITTLSAGGHSHTISDHNHGMGHFHYGPSHTHSIDSHSHSGPSHRHSFSGSDSLANGHYHRISDPGTSTITGGVSANATHNVSISGNTGYSGTGSTGSTSLTTNSAGGGLTGNAVTNAGNSRIYTTDAGGGSTSTGGEHNHRMAAHTHGMEHTHTVPAHTHSMQHYHNFSHMHNVVCVVTIPAQDIAIPAHSHVFETPSHTHSVNIPAHTHDLTLADHTHEIVYGIYEGDTASSVTLKVDGNVVPASALTDSEMDIVAYLEKDDDGKITRGTLHEIEIVPNGLTRIEANLFVQAFVQSVGGGDY